MDFIVGEKFYDVADFIYSSFKTDDLSDDYNRLVNTFSVENLKDINIIYTHTLYKNQLFDKIRNINKKFIIVTHNSDINISSVDNLPDNVIKWYSQNVNVKDARLESIPIGLENSRWFPQLQKQLKMDLKVKTEKKIKNLLYINHNVSTFTADRAEPYNIFKGKSWVTLIQGKNGSGFDDYIDNIYNHKFILSPRGNGIDTHRKWESLYLNTIPIEKRNINNSFYEDLPICLVDDWNEINEDFLNKEYERIITQSWNLDKLKMEYWIKKIKSYE